jgi:choline-sulfatase
MALFPEGGGAGAPVIFWSSITMGVGLFTRRIRLFEAYSCLLWLTMQCGCRLSSSGPRSNAGPIPEDVLLVTIDTLRFDHVGCYGDRDIQTPNLDRLAAQGTRFAEAVTPVPLTLPAHASILTGANPNLHGVRDMGGFVLGASPPTLGTQLAGAGFHTAAFVGALTLDHRFGLDRGFETYDDRMPALGVASAGTGAPERRAEVVAGLAIAWLSAHLTERFFLWVHFFDPHSPYDPPEPYHSQYRGRLYDGEIAYTDAQLGRLLEALGAQGLAQRTLIVVLGDHGESLGEHGESTHGIFLYDSTVRVPLIIAGPGVPAGKVVEQQVRSIDVMPTILESFAIAPSDKIQGVSLWPLMQDRRDLPSESRFAYLESVYPRTHFGWSELRGVWSSEWKYIQAPQDELYDLWSDPAENQNRLSRNPSIGERYKVLLTGMLGKSEEVLGVGQLSHETQGELASLGYVSAGVGRPAKLDQSRPDPKSRIALLSGFESAVELMNRRNYTRAIDQLSSLSASDPTNPLFYLRLGLCYELAGKPEGAIKSYERAIEHHAETDEMLYHYGNLLMDQGNCGKAAHAFERALALNPGYAESLNNLAACYFQMGRLVDAETAFRRLLAQSATQASAHNGLGMIRVKQGRRGEAGDEFRKALEADPHFWEAWLNRGIYYQEAGQQKEALRCLEEFVRGAPPSQFRASIEGAQEMIARLRARPAGN